MDATTLIFLALAVFVVWRLRSVLGQRTGHQGPPPNRMPRRDADVPQETGTGNVVTLPGAAGAAVRNGMDASADRVRGLAEPGSPAAQGLEAIAAADTTFDGKVFLSGARQAYEMIVSSFASGDREQLQGLLSKDVFEGFNSALSDRESRGEKVETTFVSIDKSDIVDAQLRGKSAMITIRFVSKIISATRDKAGAVIDGSADKVAEVTDVWTFSRDTKARDPSWFLVATEAGA